MKFLLIDSSTERAIVAACEGSRVVYSRELPQGLHNSHFLLPTIVEALDALQAQVRELAAIAIGCGPGSYTGMRVGAMTAKALGHGAQVPLIAIPTLHWFAPSSDGPFAVLLDAKVSGAYYLLGERKEAITTYHGIPAVAELAALGEILVPTSTLLTPNAAQLKPKVDALFPYNRWQWVECSIDPAHVACRVIDKFNRQELITDGNLELLYLRNMYAQKESL